LIEDLALVRRDAALIQGHRGGSLHARIIDPPQH
jgi:hypothetical protein